MRRYFAEQTTSKHAIKQRNHGAWHGRNGPVLDEVRPTETAKVSSPLYVDTTPDANPREVAYFEMAETRQYWPLEA
jgi:hypothetical protein